MYIKCGALEKAQQVFDELPFQDRFVWTALIAGYSEHGLGAKAITMYEQMQSKGFALDAVTFICVLQACASIQNCTKGEEVHAQIVKMHFLDKDRSVGTALVDMYAKCGSYDKALEVFDYINTRDTILWNAIITACAQLEYAEEAWNFFQQMQLESFCPTTVTFACVLKACSNLKAQAKGQEIHARIAKDHSQEHVVLGNALIDMYSKCGALIKAQKVFDVLSFRDRISWTALIVGYVQHGYGEEAISWFEHMQSQGFFADTVTLSCTLKACGSIGALNKGEEIHALIKREQFLIADITVNNALIYMYAKCGAVEKAYEVFDGLPTKNVVSWNIIISLNAQYGCSEEVMLHFKQMQHEGFSPDSITFISMLKACSVVGAAYLGQNLHDKIISVGSFDKAAVANALVTMYSSCGMLIEAHELFNKLQEKDLALLSTLMLGYSLLGDDQSVFRLFDNLIEVNMEPNSVDM
ncbi:hypothetical protein KP509_14G064000 [Ceratopteris richardii]|nr:hypothetical protein KP509_14G064000 [Ceratopteris richardii]